MNKGILILIVFFSFPVFSDGRQDVNKLEPEAPIVWVHHSISWWDWWWRKNCYNNRPESVHGLLSTLSYNNNGQKFSSAMEEFEVAYTQATKSGFKVIPTLKIQIHRGYENGKEFASWFDRNAWAERAEWLEGLLPYMHSGKMSIDFEPSWKGSTGNKRYTRREDQEKLAYAVKPFFDVVKKHGIELYVMPGGLIYGFNEIAAIMGVNLVMLDEGTYPLPDFYKTDQEKFQEYIEIMDERRKGLKVLGIKYLPGFYETALKKPGFLPAIAKLGYKEVWVFIRRGQPKVYNYNKFCLREFYDLEPYNFK
jgi:hypothetical protein